ncbi:MAG: histone deacetylase [Gemmatimonadetes bacterium]|nr:histone deacetylase [Gemmatimonadota bacterium]
MHPARLHAWTSARFTVPLPDGHRFPIAKYAALRDAVIAERLVAAECLHEPARAARDALLLVHDAAWVDAVERGTLDPAAARRLGFPWSTALAERAARAVGGTLEAAGAALTHGVAINLAGGTHHAFPSHGEGFCAFNDVAVAVRALQHDGRAARAAIVDLDVHQGNGTHAIFAGDDRVFTFSMHGGRNYPFRKVPGSLDVELDDGTGDDAYLDALARHLPSALERARADIVFYLAGADPHEGDTLGRLRLTFDGLMRRDTMVLEACRAIGLPVCITIAGGYGRDIADTVRVHCNTVRIAGRFA